MQVQVNNQTIELVEGDITEQEVGAIVNAANSQLAGGGGVDGAIHRKGGPTIMAETRVKYPRGCPTGSAVISSAGNLKAHFVIHAVGPVWGTGDEEAKLSAAIAGSLKVADELGLESISFPAISTGIFGFPKELAAQVILAAVRDHFTRNVSKINLIRLVIYDTATLTAFQKAWSNFPKS